MDLQVAGLIQEHTLNQINNADWGNKIQQGAANLYKQVGLTDVADQLSKAKADPRATAGISLVANPANYIAGLAGDAAVVARAPTFSNVPWLLVRPRRRL